jgi:hypothetical protein
MSYLMSPERKFLLVYAASFDTEVEGSGVGSDVGTQ